MVRKLFSTVEAQSSFYCFNSPVKTISDAYVLCGSQSAIPALLMGMQWSEGLLRRIPPEARHAVFGIPAGCYSVGRKKKKPSCYRVLEGKLIQHFHLASVPLLSCFHVNRSDFVGLSFGFHLAPWWTINRQRKDFSITLFNHADCLLLKKYNLQAQRSVQA